MIDNFDAMGVAGMTFAIIFIGLVLWFVATMGKKGMDMQQAKIVARYRSTRETELQRLAEDATKAQAEVAEQLKRLDGIEARLTEVERMLREVDEPSPVR